MSAKRDEVVTLKSQITAMEGDITNALAKRVGTQQFITAAMMAVSQQPDLMAVERKSLLTALVKCASDGLLPDGRDAALVKMGNKAAYMPMIGGIVRRLRDTEAIRAINTRVVYEGDEFRVVYGDDERIEHQPAFKSEKAVVVYAIATLPDGSKEREVMTVDQVEKVRGVSRAANAGPWKDWWPEMARKTVARRLLKRIPVPQEVAQVLAHDDEGFGFSAGPQPPADPTVTDINERIRKRANGETIEGTASTVSDATDEKHADILRQIREAKTGEQLDLAADLGREYI